MNYSADPQSLPVGVIVFANVVRTSVRPHFQNLEKQNKAKTMFAIGETVSLAEWIIDGIHHLVIIMLSTSDETKKFSYLACEYFFTNFARI